MAKDLFLANNNMNALDMFKYRSLYRDNVLIGPSDKKIDMWYDVPTYGKVDFANYSVYLSESNLKQLEGDKDTLLALDFVVDAFDDLQKYFQKAVTTKRIKLSGPISEMKPKKAWVSLTNLYHVHIDVLYKMFVMVYLKDTGRESKMESFEDFLLEFMKFSEQIKGTFPITKNSFIKSRFATPLVSGLIIEFDDKDRGEDFLKQKNILEDENYIFFKNAAKRFGFFIDQNVPFRLVADVMSATMKGYMSAYGIDNTKLFSSYFYKALDSDIETIQTYLIHMWNSYVGSSPFAKEIKESCSGQKLLTKIVKRDTFDINFPGKLDSDFWIEYYFKIRSIESNKKWDDSEIAQRVKNALDIKKSLDFESAMRYVEREVMKDT
ncbi:MAG: hypothetical protein Q8P81_02095 [Nanoarchaeota archaeon]|nr:hypothetical protein [Nanoarchaeota archaeon]